MYTDIADWWPVLSAPEDYAEEAEFVRKLLVDACAPRMLLELGSGGGNNASHLKQHFQMTLVDLSPGMLAVSRVLNPECEHLQGDMRSLRLGRQFDAVFIHDAIMYITSEEDLLRVFETAHIHCRPGGALLVIPDCTRELFQPKTEHGGHDREGRSLRYLEWSWDPDPSDSTYVTDFAYLLRDENGQVRCLYDQHTFGLFPEAAWLRLLEAAGFQARGIMVPHSELAPDSWEAFLAIKAS